MIIKERFITTSLRIVMPVCTHCNIITHCDITMVVPSNIISHYDVTMSISSNDVITHYEWPLSLIDLQWPPGSSFREHLSVYHIKTRHSME